MLLEYGGNKETISQRRERSIPRESYSIDLDEEVVGCFAFRNCE